VQKRIDELEDWSESFSAVEERLGEVEEFLALVGEGGDDLSGELVERLDDATRRLDEIERRRMLQGEHAREDAYLRIKPGAGGTDAMDWASELADLYRTWAEDRGFDVEVLDVRPGQEAGIQRAAFEIQGPWAYGYLRAEHGVHRLIRISPFDGDDRRHTSFAAVFVAPAVDESIEIDIDESDVEFGSYRASGPGGQHVNRTESAVRLRHEPTGVTVSCQQERSQHQNRRKAWQMLRAELYQRAREEQEREREKLEQSAGEIEFGQQIRSYFFDPQERVKDHRTGLTRHDPHRVLDGDVDEFIESYLRQEHLGDGE